MLDNISEKIVKLDQYCDLVPFVSTITNLSTLFFKCVKPVIDLFSKQFTVLTLFSTNVYFHYLSNKSTLCSICLLIPFFGNARAYLLRNVNKEDGKRFNHLGMCHSYGRDGFEQDDAKAFHYFQKSAALNYKWGIHDLGWAYLYGRGVEKNLGLAEQYLLRSADLGNIDSMGMLGEVYWEKKDTANAIKFYKQGTPQGLRNGSAFNFLAINYSQGKNGCKQDDTKAFQYSQKAAALNNEEGMVNLGRAYLYGRGVEKNLDLAEQYLLKAAGLGNVNSMGMLGDFYLEKKETANAIKFYEQEAELEDGTHDNAGININRLGIFYSTGTNGCKKDDEKAFQYFQKAAALNNNLGIHNVGWAYLYGRGVDKNLDLAEKYLLQSASYDMLGDLYIEKQNIANAIKFYEQTGTLGEERLRLSIYLHKIDGCTNTADLSKETRIHNVGCAYFYGRGIKKDLDQAEKYLIKAANLGNIDSMSMLGDLYAEKKDQVNAAKFYEMAGERGNGLAFTRLGVCYSKGWGGCKQDDEQAFIYFKKAADLNNKPGIHNVGCAYLRGRGVEKDLVQAKKYLLASASLGNVKSMHSLGDLYLEEQSIDYAIKYYKMAGELGDDAAFNALGKCYSKGINGFKQDNKQAFIYYQQAAQLGNKSTITKLKKLTQLEITG